ncbi:MAG TPA: hypothetical protein VF064_15185 [Pyrinomonadaceae bacterium]
MKLLARLVLCASLLAAFSAPALPQKKRKTACPVPPPSPFKHTGQIATSFDRSANGMRTTLEHPRAFNAAGAAIYLSASFTHQDPRRADTPSLELTFISVSPAQKFREAHDLVLLCDGAQRSFAGATSYQTRGGSGSTLEAAKVQLSYDDVLAVTRARRVSARLGAAEFELTHNHLEALRELASLMAPSPSRWRTTE